MGGSKNLAIIWLLDRSFNWLGMFCQEVSSRVALVMSHECRHTLKDSAVNQHEQTSKYTASIASTHNVMV